VVPATPPLGPGVGAAASGVVAGDADPVAVEGAGLGLVVGVALAVGLGVRGRVAEELAAGAGLADCPLEGPVMTSFPSSDQRYWRMVVPASWMAVASSRPT